MKFIPMLAAAPEAATVDDEADGDVCNNEGFGESDGDTDRADVEGIPPVVEKGLIDEALVCWKTGE